MTRTESFDKASIQTNKPKLEVNIYFLNNINKFNSLISF